jgi:hypothetical protein
MLAMSKKSSSNQVTVKLDSRVVYGLVAILAVAAAIGLGWFIGQQVGGGASQTADNAAAPAGDVSSPLGSLGDPNAAPVGEGLTVSNEAPVAPAGATGSAGSPVSLEEQPVGAAEPRLWIEEAAAENWVVNLGEIPADARFERDFTLSNIGTAPLVIEDTSASCGCTAAAVGDTNLDPGETTTLRVGYDPRVNQEYGRFIQKQVRIKSNDPLVPLVEFTISADVAAE